MPGPRYAVAGHQSYLGAGAELRILRFTSTPCRHGVPGPLYAAVRLSHTQALRNAFATRQYAVPTLGAMAALCSCCVPLSHSGEDAGQRILWLSGRKC